MTCKFKSYIVAALFPVLMALGAGARGGSVESDDSRKADYLYFEAIDALQSVDAGAPSKVDSYYLLLRRAHEINPADPYIAADLAEITLINSLADSLEREQAYAALRERFRCDPENYYNSQLFAELAMKNRRLADAGEVWQTLDSLYPSKIEPAVNLADNYFYRGVMGDTAFYAKALEIYDRLQASQPGSIDLSSRRIKILSMKKDTAAIFAEVERVRAKTPENARTELFAGAMYNYFGHSDLAREHYDLARELDPEDGAVYVTRAEFFNSVNDSVSYDREVFNALMSPSLDVEMKLQLLVEYVRNLYTDPEQRPRIEELFEHLLEVNPGEGQIHELYGIYFHTVKNADSAIEQFGYAVDLEPANEEFAFELLTAYGSKKDFKNVADVGKRMIEFHPNSPRIALMTASAFMVDKRAAEGLELLDRFDLSKVSDNRLKSVIHGQKGDLYYAMGIPDSSVVEYNRAIELDSENYMAMNNAAYHLAESGKNLEKARLYASMAAEGEPGNATILDTYAWVMFKLKEYQEARKLIDQALVAAGQGALVQSESGVSEEIAGDSVAESEDMATEIEVVESSVLDEENESAALSSDIYDHAGDIYFMTGDHRKAIEFWEKALEIDPDSASVAKKVKYKTIFLNDEN